MKKKQLSSVCPSVYFHASDDVEGAVKGASLVWAKSDEESSGTLSPEGGSESGSEGGSPEEGDEG